MKKTEGRDRKSGKGRVLSDEFWVLKGERYELIVETLLPKESEVLCFRWVKPGEPSQVFNGLKERMAI